MFSADTDARCWTFGDHSWQLGKTPKIVGIVNVTPDSFSDGGKWSTTNSAVEHALSLVAEGADILDIGGESTRPYSNPTSLDDELGRVIPVIKALAQLTKVPISIDTTKSIVAEQALDAGASIVNDISGLTLDPNMLQVCSQSRCGIIAMHMQGTPQTMQDNPTYDDVVRELVVFLKNRVRSLADAGIAPQRIVIDPGVGFGKTAAHNVEILSNISLFRAIGRPVLIGHSRKGFLKKVIGKPVDERLAGTVGVSIALAEQYTDLLRVHDVAAVKDAITAWSVIRSGNHLAD